MNFPSTGNLMAQVGHFSSAEFQGDIVRETAQKARDLAKIKAPHLTGALRRSIYCEERGPGTFAVGSPLIYSWAVEFGSGVYGTGPNATGKPIEPTSGSYLVFKINGKWVRLRFVLGQHPQPFIRPAAEEAMEGVSDIERSY